MINSWRSSDRYLSGIIMDSMYDKDLKEDILMTRLALAGNNGELDSLVHVNFLHAILLAAMEAVEIIVSDKLLAQMMPPPPTDEDEEGNGEKRRKPKSKTPHFPEDKKIVDIAQKIMSGKIKGNE